MVTNEAIAATLDAEPAPEAAATKLLAQADSDGAPDNITLLIVRFDQPDADAGNQAMHGEKARAPHTVHSRLACRRINISRATDKRTLKDVSSTQLSRHTRGPFRVSIAT